MLPARMSSGKSFAGGAPPRLRFAAVRPIDPRGCWRVSPRLSRVRKGMTMTNATYRFALVGLVTALALPGRSEAQKALVPVGGPIEAPLSLTASDGSGLELASLSAEVVVEDPVAFTELHLV